MCVCVRACVCTVHACTSLCMYVYKINVYNVWVDLLVHTFLNCLACHDNCHYDTSAAELVTVISTLQIMIYTLYIITLNNY